MTRHTPIRRQLSLTTLAVLVCGMSLSAILTWLAVVNLYLSTQRENLLAQAQLTAAALQGAALPLEQGGPYLQTANTLPGIHARLLGEAGGVVLTLPIAAADPPLPAPLAENGASISPADLRLRAEIQSALEGVPSTAIRRVISADNRRVLYAAAPLLDESAKIIGLVYLATPLPVGGLPFSLILQLLAGLLIAFLLAAGVGAALARRISHPLESVASAAAAVADGDLEQAVSIPTKILELSSLAAAFNQMTESLRRSALTRNAFLADVTHELRTPLTVISGTLETLEDGALEDLQGRGPLLASMRQETERLIRLVNDLLVLTRADAGALSLKLEAIDLQALAAARCATLARLAARRQLTLQVESAAPAWVRGDADRLVQVLDNLLDNAIRHAFQESTITVNLRLEGEMIRCAVCNQGPGIPAEHLPHIFERFYRVDPSRSRRSGGSGLGLAIVAALIAAQGGKLTLESLDTDQTTVSFWLPCAENCPAPA